MSELVSQAADTVAAESSGFEVTAVTEETDGSNRHLTFLTEIEDAGEIHEDDRKADELGQLDQLERSIEESEKDFHIEQILGKIKEDVECIKDGEVLSDMTTKNIDIINEENKEYQEKLTDSKLDEIAPINTDIKEDEKENLVIPVQTEKEEAETVVMGEELEQLNPSISITDDLPSEERVGTNAEAGTLIVDSTAEGQTLLDETPEKKRFLFFR